MLTSTSSVQAWRGVSKPQSAGGEELSSALRAGAVCASVVRSCADPSGVLDSNTIMESKVVRFAIDYDMQDFMHQLGM